jgi:hypothetical protein
VYRYAVETWFCRNLGGPWQSQEFEYSHDIVGMRPCFYLPIVFSIAILLQLCNRVDAKSSSLIFQSLLASSSKSKSKTSPSSLKQDKTAIKIQKKESKSKPERVNDAHDAKKKIKVVESDVVDEVKSVEALQRRYQIASTVISTANTIANVLLWRYISKIDNKADSFVTLARIVFAAYLIIVQGVYYLVRYLINQADDQTIIDIKSPLSGISIPGLPGMNHPLMSMLSNAATKVMKSTSMTVKEYDLQQLNQSYRTLLLEVIFGIVMHLRSPKGKMLLYLSSQGITSKLKNPVIDIHLFRLPAIGQHKRPFQSGLSSLSKMLSGQEAEPAADEVSDTETVAVTEPSSSSSSANPDLTMEPEIDVITAEDKSAATVVADKPETVKAKVTISKKIKSKGKRSRSIDQSIQQQAAPAMEGDLDDALPSLDLPPLTPVETILADSSNSGTDVEAEIDRLFEETSSSLKTSSDEVDESK